MPHEASPRVDSTRRSGSWPAVLACVLAAAACYANSFAVPFLFDDPTPGTTLDYTTRPLVWASFALNRALSGGAVWSYHLFNVLVHLACGLLLLALLRRTLPHAAAHLSARVQDGLALVITLAWLVHPLQTESVTYLSQRAESMGALFTLACLVAFRRSTSAARPLGWQVLALVALAAGFASKETAVVAPLLVWLYDAIFLARGAARALEVRRGFYRALSAVTLASFVLFVVPLLYTERTTAGFGLIEHGPIEYARTQPAVILHYLRLALWPHPLVFDYGWPVAGTIGEYLPQLLVVGALAGASIAFVLRRSWIGYAAAWFFLNLAPSSSIAPIKDLAFEHRVYLALAGVLSCVVVGGWWLAGRCFPRLRFLPAALALGLLLALAAATVRRNHDYRSQTELWRSVVAHAPRNPRGHSNLAHELIGAGRLDEALASLRTAIELDPRYHSALNRLGNVHSLRGEWDPAIQAYGQAIAVSELPSYRYGLACAVLAKGAFADAELNFRRALALEPEQADAHLGLANALVKLERPEEAIAEYREALRLDPNLQRAHTNLAECLRGQGQPREALEHYRKAVALAPGRAECHVNLGQCLAELGSVAEALSAFREANRLAPALPEPHAMIAKLLCSKADASQAERAEALLLAGKASQMTGGKRADIQETLAMAQARSGSPALAIETIERALGLPGPTNNAAFRERLLAQLEGYRREAGQ